MMRYSKILAVMLGVLASVVVTTQTSNAAWKRMSGLNCRANIGQLKLGSGPYASDGIGVMMDNGAWGWVHAKCQLDEDDRVNTAMATWINVHTLKSETYWHAVDHQLAYACVSWWNALGGACGAAAQKGHGSGRATMHPDLSAWKNYTGHPYVHIMGKTYDEIHAISYGN